MSDPSSFLPGAPSVSVIIPCRNEVGTVGRCLKGVGEFLEPPGGMEILVVEGGSNDGTREVLVQSAQRDPRIRIINNPAGITPVALNLGIRAARGEFVVRVDGHTEYAPDYLIKCLEVMRQTGADNVGGPCLTRSTTHCQAAVAAASHSRFALGNAASHQSAYEGWVDTVTYGCYRRTTLLALGLFDEELVRNQDDELNLRLVRAGGHIWQSPTIRSWYRPRSSLCSLFRQYFQYGYWKVRVIQKHRLPASPRHLVPGAFVLVLLLLALASPYSHAARGVCLGLIACYSGLVLLASLWVAAEHGWKLLPWLPWVFPCYHFGYGCGFFCGLIDFGLRRGPSARSSLLTR